MSGWFFSRTIFTACPSNVLLSGARVDARPLGLKLGIIELAAAGRDH